MEDQRTIIHTRITPEAASLITTPWLNLNAESQLSAIAYKGYQLMGKGILTIDFHGLLPRPHGSDPAALLPVVWSPYLGIAEVGDLRYIFQKGEPESIIAHVDQYNPELEFLIGLPEPLTSGMNLKTFTVQPQKSPADSLKSMCLVQNAPLN